MSEEIRALAKHMRVTDKQLRFLETYEETFDLATACRIAEVKKANILDSLRRNKSFRKLYDKITDNIDKDPRFNKAGTIGMLLDVKKRAHEAGKLEVELKVIQEINKMIEGNVAVKRQQINSIRYDVKGVVDMTKPIEEPEVIDIESKEVEDGE